MSKVSFFEDVVASIENQGKPPKNRSVMMAHCQLVARRIKWREVGNYMVRENFALLCDYYDL